MTTYINSLNEDVNEIQMFLNYNEVQYFAEANDDGRGAIKKIIDWFKKVFRKAWDALKKVFKKIGDFLKRATSKVKNLVSTDTAEVYSLDVNIERDIIPDFNEVSKKDNEYVAAAKYVDEQVKKKLDDMKQQFGEKTKQKRSKENINKAIVIASDLKDMGERSIQMSSDMNQIAKDISNENSVGNENVEELALLARNMKSIASNHLLLGTETKKYMQVYLDFIKK